MAQAAALQKVGEPLIGGDLTPQMRLLALLLEPPSYPSEPASIRNAASEIGGDWSAFGRLAHRHRVARRAALALGEAGIEVPENLAKHAKAGALAAMQQTAEVHRIQDVLDASGIDCLMLKGVVLSQTIYGDPALRESKDIDLLVSHECFGPAIKVLSEKLDYAAHVMPPVASGRYRLWLAGNKDVTLTASNGMRIELHNRLTASARLLPAIGLDQATDTVRVGPRDFAQFDSASLFTYLSTHGASSRWHRLIWLADIRAMLVSVSVEEILAWHAHAVQHGVERCTLSAMVLCEHIWGQELPPSIKQAASADHNVATIVANSMATLTDEAYVPATIRGRGYVRNAMLLRDDWSYRRSVMTLVVLDPDLVNSIPLPMRLRYLYVPLRIVQWVKRKIGKLLC